MRDMADDNGLLRSYVALFFCLSAAACGSSAKANNGDMGVSSGGSSAGGAGSNSGGAAPGAGAYAKCGGAIFSAAGKLDAAEYRRQARLWDAETIDCRLGPKFAELNPDGSQAFPKAPELGHTQGAGYLCKQYELSGDCAGGKCDYGSTSGQALYAPDEAGESGVDRVQTYGYESGTICESPQTGSWLGGPHPDPAIVQWAKMLGRDVLLPNAFHQAELYETNGGILTFPDGLVGATGNQTSGGSNPYFELPPNKVPTAVAVTGYNELALVTIWDTDTLTGQVAVFALRADSPGAFSVPYFALPNEAGFKAIHLLGYLDLPGMSTPTAVSALGNNGSTPGGHAIGNEFANADDPTKNIATNQVARMAFARDDYERWVPTSGHAVVASRWENKLAFLDLRPLFQFVRSVYFTTQEKFDASKGQDTWAYTFETSPEALPVLVTTVTVPEPTAVRVGNMLSGFPKGLEQSLHAFVANTAGDVRVFDISALADDQPRPVSAASIVELTKVQAGLNITSMRKAGHANTSLVVTSRGERAVRFLQLGENDFAVTRTLTDERLLDPVVAEQNARGPIVSVGDFTAGKILNFRIGPTENNAGKPPANYGCGPGGADVSCEAPEFGGELSLPGRVFYLGTTNVN
jgi:hypothetical protein